MLRCFGADGVALLAVLQALLHLCIVVHTALPRLNCDVALISRHESRLILKDNKVTDQGLLEVPLASQARSNMEVCRERSKGWIRKMAALRVTDLGGRGG